jgi:hypothetical protein
VSSKNSLFTFLLNKPWLLAAAMVIGLASHAQDSNTAIESPDCQRSAGYFSEFYAGLQTMHSHGLKNFAPGSADAQAYFIQVQKNGEKVEMNVLKGLRGDGTLKPDIKEKLIKLNQKVALTMRQLAEQDARTGLVRDKNAVIQTLATSCSE